MNDEALLPRESVLCGRCAQHCDPDDNYCRSCGLALRGDGWLPAVRNSAVPAVWRPRVPVVVMKSAAFVAAGTVAEIVARRLIRNAFARRPSTRERNAIVKSNGRRDDDAELESETYLLRRVRIRR